MIYRRPERFRDYLSWECYGRALLTSMLALACFSVTWIFGLQVGRLDLIVAVLGVIAGSLDSLFRHPRFFTDLSLIRELQATHRQGDFKSLMEGDLLVWNHQYAFNFLVGLFFSVVAVDAFAVGGLEQMLALRTGFLFTSIFYFTTAILWRVTARTRVMLFITQLNSDRSEQPYG